MKRVLAVTAFLFLFTGLFAASVDTVEIYSKCMRKKISCVVIKPETYGKKEFRYPVVYLLHGWSNSYNTWVKVVPQIKQYADNMGLMIVCPDGGYSSWYFDSPIDTTYRYDTFVSSEVVAYIDSHYRTLSDRNYRAVTGLSMGGHGALYLALKHPAVYGAAGSMSGGVDLRPYPGNWDIAKRIGPQTPENKYWGSMSVVNVVDNFPSQPLALMIECGTEDFFLEVNRQLHQKLLAKKIPHDYVERPGAHTWDYWSNAVEYQLLYFSKFFRQSSKAGISVFIPAGGNSWATGGAAVSDSGLVTWSNADAVCSTWFRLSKTGSLKISVRMTADGGESKVRISAFGKTADIVVGGNAEKDFDAGEWEATGPGYVCISIQGVSRSGNTFGRLAGITIGGSAVTPDMSYVRDNNDNYFYWGRRGPSVHLNYDSRGIDDIEWFYSEITVPAGNDVIGSYFMANGFSGGYFGFQVNSENERRILFSVWSPFSTDDPKAIPADQRIRLLKKGKDVHAGEFGSEGSGGQSYMKYPWKAGNTYGFLLRGVPGADSTTVYTAWFFAPEKNQWMLIASFKRPKTKSWLKGLHSFLENFEPETGNKTRMAYYSNQWACDSKGQWHELCSMKFTGDMTARKNFRKDYAGGADGDRFFLKNCGFFDESTPLDKSFDRRFSGRKPAIDLNKLP